MAAQSGSVSDALSPPLRALYATCDGADLPIGSLYPQRLALERSEAAPFHPDWVVCGDDGRGTFWLCAREPEDGLWFTTWDHDAGVEIDGAVWPDLAGLLRGVFADLLSIGRGEAAFVIEDVPAAARMDVVRELGTLVSAGSAERLRMLKALPVEVPSDDAQVAYDAVRRLRPAGVRCHLRIDWL
ncbi:MAG TPA: hypothetical protein VFZ20_01600 [Longimicrobium sp.]|nr:hypothetical protein [Longimicrobium sp.]